MGNRAGAAIGVGAGIAVAFAFALVISVLPSWVFLEATWRAVVYVACAAAAAPTVLFTSWVARIGRLSNWDGFIWAMAGAMLFDGLAIGFVPQLYGHTGQALAWAASALLFAFASNLFAAQLMLRRNGATHPV